MADGRPGYHPAALASALAIVRRATSVETARFVDAVICAHGRDLESVVRLRAVAEAVGFGIEPTRQFLEEADRAFAAAFSINLIDRSYRQKLQWSESDALDGAEAAVAKSAADEADEDILLSPAFVEILDCPFPRLLGGDMPEPDPATSSWITIVAACLLSGTGHHLALRCLERGPRETTDVARLVAARGVPVVHVAGDKGETPERVVLRAELHAGDPAVVVIDREFMTEKKNADDEDGWDNPVVEALTSDLSEQDAHRLQVLRDVRNTYVWRAPANLIVDADLAVFYGAVFGPIAATRRWRDAMVADMVTGIGGVGAQALISRLADPRDAGALAAMTSVAAGALLMDLDEAAVFVARSLSGALKEMPATPADFDARLVVCNEEGQLLLARARELARNGGRVLLWGPPGGGKSTFAQALATAMGRGSQVVTAAMILARHWGMTERIIADLWSRAAADGTSLVIDEIDSLCGVREPAASGGNAYLVRTLTNEFLRVFDGHAAVPVIATANHLEAIDPAVTRRFTFVVEVRDELTPEAEVLAWRSLLQLDPPVGWVPIGAAVSDFANAARRCRMLGLMDTRSLAAAVESSRDARLGPRRKAPHGKRVLQ